MLDATENKNAAALTAPFVAGFDIVIDFTTPEAVIQNMRACLAVGAKMVIGTTGWYDRLPDMRALAERRGASLLYATNFSIGVQLLFELAKTMASQLKTWATRSPSRKRTMNRSSMRPAERRSRCATRNSGRGADA